MNSISERPPKRAAKSRLALAALHNEVTALRQRVEDLEALRELNQAVDRNRSKSLTSWARTKKELGLE